MFSKLLSIPSSIILWCMGWSQLNLETQKLIQNHSRMVCVFSHTSYYDFFIMLLYYFSNPSQLCHLKTLIKPDYFKTIGYLLRLVGGIPSTHISERNGGSTQRIINELLKTEKSHFLISPKGTIVKGEWRSGYYHIAKALNCPIIALGLDYELKKITICQPILPIINEECIKKLLYHDLSKIVPLHPEQEMMPIRAHKSISVVNKTRLCIICLISYMIYYMYKK